MWLHLLPLDLINGACEVGFAFPQAGFRRRIKRKREPEPEIKPPVVPEVIDTTMADAMRKARASASKAAVRQLDAAIEQASKAEIDRMQRIKREQEDDEDDVALILSLL